MLDFHTMGLHSLTSNDLMLFIPMALAGAVFLSAVPIASRMAGRSLRLVGALFGALVALLVVEALPMLL